MSEELFYRLAVADSLKYLGMLAPESIHAVVTDPPYGIAFMGKKWDAHASNAEFQKWCEVWARECLRVLKPGGFILSFGATRTYHRLASGVEDAGFEVKDTFMWGYDSGFPKAQDVSMLVKKKLGGKGEVVGPGQRPFGMRDYTEAEPRYAQEYSEKRATLEGAKRWAGWKTPAVKPAWEPIVVARKPFEGSLTENVLANEVGAFNIDEARVPYQNAQDAEWERKSKDETAFKKNQVYGKYREVSGEAHPLGRYPSNLLLTDELFSDGRSKYYYAPKAGGTREEDASGVQIQLEAKMVPTPFENIERFASEKKNFHPTVKPIELMERLIKLVTRPGQVVLDPFLGSGTTLLAAKRTGRSCVGVELSLEYAKIARERFGPTLGAPLEFIQTELPNTEEEKQK